MMLLIRTTYGSLNMEASPLTTVAEVLLFARQGHFSFLDSWKSLEALGTPSDKAALPHTTTLGSIAQIYVRERTDAS